MRPLVLRMQAFGPFGRAQEIDFRRLGEKTFFLIHGPTGSGKTSVLDAMCLALFGDSSGEERKPADLRSQHAEAGTLTEVSFEFSLGPRRYRVCRVPEQMRPAKRGGGLTRQAHTADLFELEEAGQERAIETGWEKVTRKVVSLLGFESRQFRQVIVLPQGKFFEFLKSSSQEREKILQVLFGTDLYRRIEEALKRAADELARQAMECETQRSTLLRQAQVGDFEALRTVRADEETALEAARIAEEAAVQAEAVAQQQLHAGMQLAARFAELDAARSELDRLQAQEAGWSKRRLAVAAARRAATLGGYEKSWREAQVAAKREKTKAAQCAAALAAADSRDQLARVALQRQLEVVPRLDAAIAWLAKLEALQPAVELLSLSRSAHKQAADEHSKEAAQLGKAQEAAAGASTVLQQVMDDIERTAPGAAGLEAARLKLQQVEQWQQLLGERAAQRRQADEALASVNAREAEVARATEKLTGASAARQATFERWIAGQSARIAHALVEGEACPVCGSKEHPRPATAGPGSATDKELKAAEDAVQRATAEVQGAQAQLEAARQQHASCTGALRVMEAKLPEMPRADVDAHAAAARVSVREAEAAAAALARLQARLPEAQEDSRSARALLEAAQAAERKCHGELRTAAATLAEREQQVPKELAASSALQAALAAARRERDQLRGASEQARQEAMQAAEQLATARALAEQAEEASRAAEQVAREKEGEFLAREKEAGFEDEAAYLAASLEPAVLQAEEREISGFDAPLAAAVDRNGRATEQIRELARPDMAALEAASEGARAAKVAAVQRTTGARAALATTDALMASVAGINERYDEVEQRHRVLAQLAQTANGQNPQRLSFQRYVLATLLDEVLAATTQRLRVMSRGRYEMRRRLEAVDGRSAAGLDLEVFDHYTGSTRGVNTLSGGESFLASLALALGLSDVVQSYAGGIRLDAIFVDEGFGTLDPEALDFAIRTLKDLQQAGRMVGIISHVAELKGWIDARLELKPSQAGSEATFIL